MENNIPKRDSLENSNGRSAIGGTIAGFLLFLSGALLMFYGLLDIVVRIDSIKTACYLVVGLAMYKVGQALLKHFAAFKVKSERRRAPYR